MPLKHLSNPLLLKALGEEDVYKPEWDVLRIIAGMAMLASLAIFVSVATAGSPTPNEVNTNIGLTALIVVTVLVPTIGGMVWLIKRIVALFSQELAAQRIERENMSAAQQVERERLAEAVRIEREQHWVMLQQLQTTAAEMSTMQTRAIDRLCNEFARRPCVGGANLLKENQSIE